MKKQISSLGKIQTILFRFYLHRRLRETTTDKKTWPWCVLCLPYLKYNGPCLTEVTFLPSALTLHLLSRTEPCQWTTRLRSHARSWRLTKEQFAWGTNSIGGYRLTNRCLPRLKKEMLTCRNKWEKTCKLEFHETCHSFTFIVLVNSHQRWKQTRFRVCFHLWCELTLAL